MSYTIGKVVLKLLGVYPSISLFDTETLKRVE